MEIVFASSNKNKLEEIAALCPDHIKLIGLEELGITEEIPETSPTLVGNALQKASYVFERFQKPVFADDTGLEIEALDGRPGVYSARYAGEGKDANANMDKVLAELSGKENRKACFKTVIAFIDANGEQFEFEGRVDGEILEQKTGEKGFGYDPIFRPDAYDVSFAEMPLTEKNKISHRARATQKFVAFLAGL